MRFLVDECVARPLVPALRLRFADVVYVADTSPATKDRDVLAWAVREKRVLVTEDYDFGDLVFRLGRKRRRLSSSPLAFSASI